MKLKAKSVALLSWRDALPMMAVAAALAVSASTPAVAAEKLTLMVGGMEKIIYLPAKLTESLGYFKEQGLDVELASEPAGVNATNELVAGSIQGAVGFYDHTIDLQAKGKKIESVVTMGLVSGHAILASSKAKDINSPADFAGKTIGVTGLGSSTAFLVQYLAKKNGVDPAKVRLLSVGAGATFVAAIKNGSIDAGITTEPTISRVVNTDQGRLIVDLRTPDEAKKNLGGLYPAASLYMSTAYVESHPEVTQKLVNAFVKTMQYIATHSAEDIADKMPKDYYAGDKAAYVKALADAKVMFSADGRMPADGAETVLSVLKEFKKEVQKASIDLGQTYTNKYVDGANAAK